MGKCKNYVSVNQNYCQVYMNDLVEKETDLKAVLKNNATPITSKWLIIALSSPLNN